MTASRFLVRTVSSEALLKAVALLGWGVLALLVAAAALARFRIAPVAISEWDSWGWLNPALSWLGGPGFREHFEREWLYGAFIATCLRFTGSFSGYVVIQQVLGLLAGVLMWLTWRTWTTLFPRHLLFEIGSAITGLAVVAVYLFSPIALLLELSIRPEGIMAFVAFLQLYCVTSYCKFRWHEPRPAASAIFGALAIPFAYALFVLKPNWLLAVPATTLPVFIGVFGKAAPLAVRLLTPFAGIFLILVTLLLPEKIFFIPMKDARVVLPMTLFTVHADVIYEDMARELAAPGTPEEKLSFLRVFLPVFDREMQTARTLAKYYPRLGFDPDYLMYRSSMFPFLENSYGMSRKDIAAFCRASFLSAVWNQPSSYARKVFTQLGYFVFPDDGTFFRTRVQMGKMYEYALTTVPDSLDDTISRPVDAVYDTYHQSLVRQAGQLGTLEVFRPFRSLLRLVKTAAFWIEIAFFFSLAACLLIRPLARLRLPGFVALVFFLAPACNALTVALVHALDNSRYRGSYGPLLLFALAGLFLFFLTTLACAVTMACRKQNRVRIAPPH
ncbi:MAG: hypothetical protein WBX20_01005 [Terrimicrobiaceae bacterium]